MMKNNIKNTFIQITAGRGPVECQYVVAKVLSLLLDDFRKNGLIIEVIHRVEGFENATLQSATLQIQDEQAYNWREQWLGTIQWIEKSPYRKLHKRKNWFIGIFELTELKINELNEKDIEFQTMRSSGAGGQHVNKVSSAVRAIHTPTGVSVVCQDSRPQHQNKKTAIERLKMKVNEENLIQMKNQITEKWEKHLQLERGNPVQTIIGQKFNDKKEEKTYKKKRNELKRILKKDLE